MCLAALPGADLMASLMKLGRRACHERGQRGSSYIGVLLLVAALGVGLARAGADLVVQERREREAALLVIGAQFQAAIARYYDSAPGGRYPSALSDLVEDNRSGATLRHLRRVYADPLDSSSEWGLVAGPDKTIVGVFSQAPGQPIKQANFPPGYEGFNEKSSYAEWIFVDRKGQTNTSADEGDTSEQARS